MRKKKTKPINWLKVLIYSFLVYFFYMMEQHFFHPENVGFLGTAFVPLIVLRKEGTLKETLLVLFLSALLLPANLFTDHSFSVFLYLHLYGMLFLSQEILLQASHEKKNRQEKKVFNRTVIFAIFLMHTYFVLLNRLGFVVIDLSFSLLSVAPFLQSGIYLYVLQYLRKEREEESHG